MSNQGWNRPSGEKKEVERKGGQTNVHLKAILAGLIVVVGASLAAIWFFHSSTPTSNPDASAKRTRIKEVKPEATPAKKGEVAKVEPPPVVEPDTNLLIRTVTNLATGTSKVITNDLRKLSKNRNFLTAKSGILKPPRKLYKTHAENIVVGMLRSKPGSILPLINLPANFDEEFKARIADPVGIEPEDTEAEIEIRRQMVEFKKAAAVLIGEGMTPTEIVMSERKEMNRLSEMRNNLAAEIGSMRREGASAEEVSLAVEAANILLERKGAPKIIYKTKPTKAGGER